LQATKTLHLLLNLNKHIASLLHFHNYVVVPGLGGFIAKEQSARLNDQGNVITPPRKEIAFNPVLLTGDGLLLQELVKLEGLSYQLAESVVHDTVSSWTAALNLGRSIQLEGIGQLRKNIEGKIVFRQYSHSNFLVSSFGLEIASISKPTVQHANASQLSQSTEPQTIVIEQLPVNYKRFRIASLAAIVFLSVSATYLYMLSFNPSAVEKAGLNFFDVPILSNSEISNIEQTRELLRETEDVVKEAIASTEMVSYAPPTEQISGNNNIEVQNNDVPSSTDEVADATQTTEESASSEPEVAVEEVTETEESTDVSELFHVIVSSVASASQIDMEVERFKQKGYTPIVLPTDNESYRISIGGFESKTSASDFKSDILNDNNISSWILTPKQ